MRIALASIFGAAFLGFVQVPPAPVEHGTLRLHYVQKPIGYERYDISHDGDAIQMTSDFDFTDRGGNVHLNASLRTKPDFTPIHFTAKGKSYRFVNVDSDVAVDGAAAIATVRADGAEMKVPLPAPFYTVDGYAPFAAQMLMLRYWKTHGQPRIIQSIPGSPTNEVIVESRGHEAIRIGSKTVRLERFVIDGVVWGRETLWLDDDGSLAAAITRAGGLSFEAVREDLESALVSFVQRGTTDRLGDLEAITARTPPLRTGAYAMVGGTIVDGTGRPAIDDGVIVVRDGNIADVGPRASVRIPDGVAIVPIAGRTVIPGLWDMHSHVTQIEWAPVYLGAGVTTVRDMGNEFEFITALRKDINAGRSV